MTMTSYDLIARNQYNQDAILSASPSRLLTMLFDRLMLDLQRAEAAQLAQDWAAASTQLKHAQDVVAELSGSLQVDRWDGGQNLLAIYLFCSTQLVQANLRRDVEATRAVAAILEPLRQTWHEAAGMLVERAQPVAPTGTDGVLGFG